jgi:hypothetical protein
MVPSGSGIQGLTVRFPESFPRVNVGFRDHSGAITVQRFYHLETPKSDLSISLIRYFDLRRSEVLGWFVTHPHLFSSSWDSPSPVARAGWRLSRTRL